MSEIVLNFDCTCSNFSARSVPGDATAAYCSRCLGWLKRPNKAGTVSESQRKVFLLARALGIEIRESNLSRERWEALASELEERQAKRGSTKAEDHESQPIAKVHKGGRPKIKGPCRNGHAAMWRHRSGTKSECLLCRREREHGTAGNRYETPSERLAV